jgi:hypothetical protein
VTGPGAGAALTEALADAVAVDPQRCGQGRAEARELAAVRDGLPARPPCPCWPGERQLPASTDPIAARWGFSCGVDLVRLRAAMTRPVEPLPDRGR